MITYHTNVDRFDPTIRERAILDEIDNCNKDILQISQCMSKVCNIFHPVRALPKDSHFDPGKIPFLLYVFCIKYLCSNSNI